MFDLVLLGFYKVSELNILFIHVCFSFYTILKQRIKIFWSSTLTNFSYEPPLSVMILTCLLAFVWLR
jgi:hypothetical protein